MSPEEDDPNWTPQTPPHLPPDPRDTLRARLRSQGYTEQQIDALMRPGLPPLPQPWERRWSVGNVILLIVGGSMALCCITSLIVGMVQAANGH